MKVIKDYLKLLCDREFKDEHIKKLLYAVKYYLSRACSTVRDPRIIQTNHYVDEYCTTDKVNSKHIVLSPSIAPFPIAYFVNFTLVKNNESKLFYLNNKDEIVIHPYEYTIPLFIALFSGSGDVSLDLCPGKLFLVCILVSGEIAVGLITAGLLQQYEAVCVAAVIVIAAVWNLSKKSVAYLIDDIVYCGANVDMQACLQAVNRARCHPSWFTDDYLACPHTEALLSFVDSHIVTTSDVTFLGLDSLLFCFLGLSPIGSLLAAALGEAQTGAVSIIIPMDIFVSNVRSKGEQEQISSTQRQLSRFIACSRTKQNSNSSISYSVTEEITNEVSIEAVDKEPLSMSIKITTSQANKEYSLREMSSILSGLNHLLMPQMEWDLQVVLGVCATNIVMKNIDTLLTQASLVKAFELVFSRPALD